MRWGCRAICAPTASPWTRRRWRVFLDRVHALGLRVLVTEHDVGDAGGPAAVAARDRAVAEASARFLDVAATHPATDAVLTWGLSDRFLDSAGARMLPLDRKLRRKPMWQALARAFDAR